MSKKQIAMIVSVLGIWMILVLTPRQTIPIRVNERIAGSALDLAHAPFFMILTIIVLSVVKAAGGGGKTKIVTCVFLVLFAIATEMAQGLSGRDASWADGLANLVGFAAGAFWSLPSPRRGWHLGVAVALILAIWTPPGLILYDCGLQSLNFPQLSSFEQPLEQRRWFTSHVETHTTTQHATEGDYALQIDMRPAQYPAVTYLWPVANWNDYDQLVFDVWLAGESSLPLHVKVLDGEHHVDYEDRYNGVRQLHPGSNTIRILLADIRNGPKSRKLQLDQIWALELFVIDLKQPTTLYLDNVRLE